MDTMETLNCSHCGNPFSRRKAQINMDRRAGQVNFFCSKKCYGASMAQKVELICTTCGNKFYRHPGDIKKAKDNGYRSEFCSRQCWHRYLHASRTDSQGRFLCTGCHAYKPKQDFVISRRYINGIGTRCKKCVRQDTKSRRKIDPQRFSETNLRSRQKLRYEALTHYSGDPPQCACCGETEMAFLTIDHADGSGNKHRKALHAARTSLYPWLRKHGFPDGFQVLCMNCNWATRYGKPCPHKLKSGIS